MAHEDLLSAILDGMQDAVVAVNQDGRIVIANPATTTLLGLSLVGRTLSDWAVDLPHLLPDGKGWYPDEELPLARALRGAIIDEAIVIVRPPHRPEGLWLSMSARPLPGGAVAVIRDITSRKALLDSEAVYRSLVESLPFCLFRKDREGRFTYANHVFCDCLGLNRDQVIGQTEFDFLSPTLAERYRQEEDRVIETGLVLQRLEEHLSFHCGPHCRCGPGEEGDASSEPRYIQSLLAPIVNSSGQVIGTQGAFWDVTQEQRIQRELAESAANLQRLNEELKRSNEDLEQFAYVASHDLQQPLRMVTGFTQLLQKRLGDRLDEESREFIGFAVEGASRMQRLINDLLAYSRVTTKGKEPTETSSQMAFDLAVRDLKMMIEETQAQVTADSLPVVKADPTQLRQLFQNLLGNALKFRRGNPRIHVGAELDRGAWLFRVQDNGIGIEKRHLERIFQIFQRLHTQEAYPGTGIGLAICKQIVQRHGGKIWIESEVGVGSVFCFTLPVQWFEAD